MEIEIDEMAAMRAGLKAPKVEAVIEKVEPAVEKAEPIIEKAAPIIERVEAVVEKTEPVVTGNIVPEVKTKSFDEEFTERFEGKYKSVDELKAALSAPKDDFADDDVRHWNELKKNGVKLDKEFFDLQALNLDGDAQGNIDPEFILLETMKRKEETKGLSEKTLKLQLDKKYNLSEWVEKDEADLTDDDVANREILMRDAQSDLGWLQNFKKERTFVKPVDENMVRQQSEERELSYSNFDRLVDTDVVAKVLNLSTVVDDKTGEKFDYKISEADGREYGKLMKDLVRGKSNLFDQFAYTDDKGVKQISHQKVFEMLIKNKNYDQAVKNAFNDGKALGSKKEIMESKNTNFTQPEGRTTSAEPKTEREAFMQAMEKQGKKF